MEFFSNVRKISEKNPDYTVGEVLYNSLQSVAVRNNSSVSFLLKLKDEELINESFKGIKK